LLTYTQSRSRREDIEEKVVAVSGALKDLVELYKIVLVGDASHSFGDEDLSLADEVELPQEMKLNEVMSEGSLIEYVLTRRTYSSIPPVKIFRSRDGRNYRLDVEVPNEQRTISVAIPPETILDAVYVLTNRELLEFIADRTKLDDLSAKIKDMYILAESVIASKPSVGRVVLKDKPLTALVVNDIGKVLKVLSIGALFDPYDEEYVFTITALMNYKGDDILYHIPDHKWEKSMESFTKLLIYFGGEEDIQKLRKLTNEFKQVIQVSFVFLKVYSRYSTE